MSYCVGLDSSVKLTAICIIDDVGKVVMERIVASGPGDIGRCIEEIDGEAGRTGLEAVPLAPWLFGGLAGRGLPAVCIEVRQMKAFAKASPIKTDRREARLIAQAMCIGLFKIAHVKTGYSQGKAGANDRLTIFTTNARREHAESVWARVTALDTLRSKSAL